MLAANAPSLSPLVSELALRLLLRHKSRLLVLDSRAHSINTGLTLLRALVHHHGCRRAARARVSVRAVHGLRGYTASRDELGMSRIHLDLRTGCHQLAIGPWDELRLHHNRTAHVVLLLGHELGIVREAAERSHLRRTARHVRLHHRLAVLELTRSALGIDHGRMSHPRRRERLLGV